MLGVRSARIYGETVRRSMTQEGRWLVQWKAVMDFMMANHRRPSKFVDSERGLRKRWKHQQKLVNAGELKEERIERFKELLDLGERYRRVNQYM